MGHHPIARSLEYVKMLMVIQRTGYVMRVHVDATSTVSIEFLDIKVYFIMLLFPIFVSSPKNILCKIFMINQFTKISSAKMLKTLTHEPRKLKLIICYISSCATNIAEVSSGFHQADWSNTLVIVYCYLISFLFCFICLLFYLFLARN